MSARHARGLWWAKRDLRLVDNDALALAECDTVLALYVAEPSPWRAPESSALHHHAWGQATAALGRSLAARGGRLCLRTGEVVDVLERLYEEDGFDALYAREETGTALTFARDEAVRAWARRRGVPFRELPQSGVIRGLAPVGAHRLGHDEPASHPSGERGACGRAQGRARRGGDTLAQEPQGVRLAVALARSLRTTARVRPVDGGARVERRASRAPLRERPRSSRSLGRAAGPVCR